VWRVPSPSGVVVLYLAFSNNVVNLLEPLAVSPAPAPDQRELHTLHAFPAFFFCSIAAQTVIGMALESRQEMRDIAAPVMAVSAVAGLFYMYGYFQNEMMTTSYFPGGHQHPLRYLMWAFTTPCFIFSAGQTTGWSASSIHFFMLSDIVMIVAGYVATVEASLLCAVAEAVSCAAFAVTIAGWVCMEVASYRALRGEVRRHVASSSCKGGESRMKGMLKQKVFVSGVEMVSWVGFPVVWYASKYGWVDAYSEELLYVALDVLSKGIYALCESGLAKSINHVLWESAVVREALEREAAAAAKQTAGAARLAAAEFADVTGGLMLPEDRSRVVARNSVGGFPIRDLSKLPAHYEANGFLEILLVESDLSTAAQVAELASSMGAKATHFAHPAAAVGHLTGHLPGRASSERGRMSSEQSPMGAVAAAVIALELSRSMPRDSGASTAPRESTSRGGRERLKVRPDIVFIGYCPEWKDDWIRLVKWLDASFKSEIPLILMVTPDFIADDNEDGVMSEALSSGASDFMVLPIHRVSLHTRVKNLLEISAGKAIKKEKERMSELLQRMLPERVMRQLLSGQGVIADSHPDVTLLFADIVGFTALSSSVPTSEIILILNELFSEFDRAVDLANVYKVETIGDCYMCAAGHDANDEANSINRSHAQRMVDMGMRIIDAVEHFKSPHDIKVRIGIHTGNVFTGVVGTKCPRWCFFGDTVNTASRMESTSFPMCIQISDTTLAALEDEGAYVETVEYPSVREIKGKGSMTTHLVKYGEYRAALECKLEERPKYSKREQLPDAAPLIRYPSFYEDDL